MNWEMRRMKRCLQGAVCSRRAGILVGFLAIASHAVCGAEANSVLAGAEQSPAEATTLAEVSGATADFAPHANGVFDDSDPSSVRTGEAADTMRLTLSEAIAQALTCSARLEALSAIRRGADAGERAARVAGLPSLDLSAGYTRYSHVPEFALQRPDGTRQTIAPNIPDAWRMRATATLPLWTGGRISETVEAARNERLASGSDLEAGRAELVLETTSAYWNLGKLREQVSVMREALAAYDVHLQDAQNRAKNGLAAHNELLAIQVERDRAELGLVQSSGAATVAAENLRRLIGAPGETFIAVLDDPGIAVDGPSGDTEHAGSPVYRQHEADSLVTVALSRRPERTAMVARVQAADARTRAEGKARWPQIATVAGYDYANPNRRLTPPQERWKQTWYASVHLEIPVFDFGRTSAATARARAQFDALRQQVEDLDRRIRQEVTSLAIEEYTAKSVLTVATRAVESAKENQRVTRDRYREGLATSSDLLDAEVLSLRAALDQTDAQTRMLMARANLARAVGRTSDARTNVVR
jgi:outer membrane protein